MKTQAYDYPHPDWRVWYFGVLLLFYLGAHAGSASRSSTA